MSKTFQTTIDLGDIGECDAVCEMEISSSPEYFCSTVVKCIAWVYKDVYGRTDFKRAGLNVTDMLTRDALSGIATKFDEWWSQTAEDREVARQEAAWELREDR